MPTPPRPDTRPIHEVWNNSQQMISKVNVDLEKPHLDEIIATVFSNGPFYFYIIDWFDMQIKYMSPAVKDIHGLDPAATTFQDIMDQIHPDDIEFVSKAETKAIDVMFNTIGMERQTKYKISYCFRFKTTDGSYKLFNHQSITLTTDKDGRTAKNLNIHTNISHLTSENNHKVSIIGMFGEPSYLNMDVTDRQQPSIKLMNPLFSKRETEIIRLLSEGNTSVEIASKLFIAENTVKNHRKNILQKANCKNVGQLISKCITEGLL